MIHTKTKPVDDNETKVEVSGSVVVPVEEVDEFQYELQKLIGEYAIWNQT